MKEDRLSNVARAAEGLNLSAFHPISIVWTNLFALKKITSVSISTRRILRRLNISCTSVRRITKEDLNLTAFRRVPAQVITDAVRQTRLERSSALLRRLKVRDVKRVFFTDEEKLLSQSTNQQPEQSCLVDSKKADVRPNRLIVEREKFAPHVMVSAGVCFGDKGRLHFVDEKAKVDAAYYVGRLLPELIADCKRLLPAGFIFQQDGAPAHTACLAWFLQDWLAVNCPGFIEKDQWPPNSPRDLESFGITTCGELCWKKYYNLRQKPKTIRELKVALELI